MFPSDTQILIVEDMANMREMIVELCKELGFSKLIAVQDGAHAWEAIQDSHHPIQLIISDLNMPHSNGLDLLKRIRRSDRFKNIPFLMMSADSDEKDILQAVRSGADHYLVKPFGLEHLREKLMAIHQKRASTEAT